MDETFNSSVTISQYRIPLQSIIPATLYIFKTSVLLFASLLKNKKRFSKCFELICQKLDNIATLGKRPLLDPNSAIVACSPNSSAEGLS